MTAKLSRVLLALVHERVSRFRIYLEEVSLSCSDAERRLVYFLDTLLHEVSEREIRRAKRMLSPSDLIDGGENDATRFLILAAYHMDILLSETEVFPRQRPPLEVYDFLESTFPEVSTKGWELAVVLWPVHNFGVDPDLAERLKKALGWMPPQPPKHVVLYLAEIERNNPIMWALLAHEMGHALDEAKKIGETILGSEAAGQIEESPRWIAELVADTIAIRVLGPAYFCAFASLTLLDNNPTYYSDSHPALHKRLEMLKQELERMGVLEKETRETVDGYHQLIAKRIENEPRYPQDRLNWEDTFNRVREAVDRQADELRKFNGEDRGKSEELSKLLNEGIPISSFLERKNLESINSDARQLLFDQKENPRSQDPKKRLARFKRRLNKLIKGLTEEPTHPIEILNAGWIGRWIEILDWCSRSGTTNEWNKWWNQVQKGDAILKKSIEAIPIHQGLQGNKHDSQ